MRKRYIGSYTRNHNPNWKGGICQIKTADSILDAVESIRKVIFEKLLKNYKLSQNGCWEWTSGRFNKGYARIAIGSKNMLAHKVSYILHKNGKVGNLCVCHKCDNPICINPDHLFLGTNKDNSQDMSNKGRTRKQNGSLNSMAILDESKVREIKGKLELFNNKLGIQRLLAKEYNVSFQTISLIKLGKIWKHI